MAAKLQSPERQLAGFIAKFTPDIAALTYEVLAKMRARLPGSLELVYDNYNALAIGFAPTERMSETIFSIAVFPRGVSLYFFYGVLVPDPETLLQGSGNQGRYIRLVDAKVLDEPGVKALMKSALELADPPIKRTTPHRIIIKSISAKQRPRRPSVVAKRSR